MMKILAFWPPFCCLAILLLPIKGNGDYGEGNYSSTAAIFDEEWLIDSPAMDTVVEFLAKFETLSASTTADVGSFMERISFSAFAFLKLAFRVGSLIAGSIPIATKPESEEYRALVKLSDTMNAKFDELTRTIAVAVKVIVMESKLYDYINNVHVPLNNLRRYVTLFWNPAIEKRKIEVELFKEMCYSTPQHQITPLGILDYIYTHTVKYCSTGLSPQQISLLARFVPLLRKIRMQISSELSKKHFDATASAILIMCCCTVAKIDLIEDDPTTEEEEIVNEIEETQDEETSEEEEEIVNEIEETQDDETSEEEDEIDKEIEIIEDEETTEEEDMAKALALSKTYFWRKMLEGWHCKEETLNEYLIDDNYDDEDPIADNNAEMKKLIAICKKWKTMALAADEYAKSWGKCTTKTNKCVTAVKPRFLLTKWKKGEREERELELLISSAMAAIVLIGREMLLKEEEGIDYFGTIEIIFENKDKCAVTLGMPYDSVDLSRLSYEEKIAKRQRNYLEEFKTSSKYLLTKKEGMQFAIVKEAHDEYEKLWGLVPEIGIDLIYICKNIQNKDDDETDLNEFLEPFEKMTAISDPSQMYVLYGEFLGILFANYQTFFDESKKVIQKEIEQMVEKIKTKTDKEKEGQKQLMEMKEFMAKKLKDPCEETKLRVKKARKTAEEDHSKKDEQKEVPKAGSKVKD